MYVILKINKCKKLILIEIIEDYALNQKGDYDKNIFNKKDTTKVNTSIARREYLLKWRIVVLVNERIT